MVASPSRLRSHAKQRHCKADFEVYLDGFSENGQAIIQNFKFRSQFSDLSKADAVATVPSEAEGLLDERLKEAVAP